MNRPANSVNAPGVGYIVDISPKLCITKNTSRPITAKEISAPIYFPSASAQLMSYKLDGVQHTGPEYESAVPVPYQILALYTSRESVKHT
jgi:hypothetical protein